MANCPDRLDRPACCRWWSAGRRRWWVVTLLLAIAALQSGGCSCRSETPAEKAARLAKERAEKIALEEKRLEEEQRRRPLVLEPARTLPAGEGSAGEGAAALFAKPGHWNAVLQPAKANAEDFDGTVSYEVVGKDNASFDTQGSPLRLVSRRPLVVARESRKTVDALFYCPPTGGETPYLRSIVRQRRTDSQLQDVTPALRPLADHQYHLVVLAKEPQRYAFMDSLRSVTATLPSAIDPTAIDGAKGRLKADKNYRVVAVPADVPSGEVALPDNALAWTSIAYVVWDEVDPESLQPAQREALIDWLNWGGQLVINGPDSLDQLRGSFLEPLLPAMADGAEEITAKRLNELEQGFSIGDRGSPLNKEGAWSGVALVLADGAQPVRGTAGLLVERRVGRGRVVVTAMQLADRRLLRWSKGYDNFFNAAVLRRPPRRFVPRDPAFNDYGLEEVEGEEPEASPIAVVWAEGEPVRLDPLRNTGWRGFVRDTHADPEQLALTLAADDEAASIYNSSGEAIEFANLKPAPVPGGAGATNDFGAVSSAVRATLRESAGVSVPGASFVIGCLAVYLFVLVPANWGFFAAIRRPELAWVAAPLIALAAGWVVIQQAQLDIGFVRAQTEIGVLELQPDTPRGLLTRYTALYSSLSTIYELEFDAPTVAAPFPSRERDEKDSMVSTPSIVAFVRQDKTRLRDLAASSATTEFVRSEEMFDVGAASIAGSSTPGAIRLAKNPSGGPRLENRTGWLLEDVVVVGRPDGLKGEPHLEGCWLGDLEPGSVANVVFLPTASTSGGELPFVEQRRAAAKLRDDDAPARLNLDNLLRLALDPKHFEPGERRVVARVSQVMPGLEVTPSASQKKGATLVVGALGYGPLPAPRQDINGPLDVN
ncbi:hypothetical protein [Botrimarina mediterranea]|uniref:hypothetical protein n=1 Tax=Botrimarina mediterranea TaxID=2528022 RepID=UPI00118AB26D|nr:hypothetical protein K2D_41230 [Planctomycetes bacterium K2D]